jgi:hypothetical protein
MFKIILNMLSFHKPRQTQTSHSTNPSVASRVEHGFKAHNSFGRNAFLVPGSLWCNLSLGASAWVLGLELLGLGI